MLKKVIYSKHMLIICRVFFGMFYKKEYLTGKYYEKKRLGWMWALRGIQGRVFGRNRKIPWPVGKNTLVSNGNNIKFHSSSINAFQMPGCYYQCHRGKIIIGKNLQIAPNCGIITTNHDVYNPENHIDGKDVNIGDNCWIGMNSMILPGVTLGDNTIVGAGSVVTKSFEDGYMVIAGNPAKLIYRLDKSKFDNNCERQTE